nr:hypothetical protein GCM10020063_087290 [Dactylosporangium thailandense]
MVPAPEVGTLAAPETPGTLAEPLAPGTLAEPLAPGTRAEPEAGGPASAVGGTFGSAWAGIGNWAAGGALVGGTEAAAEYGGADDGGTGAAGG